MEYNKIRHFVNARRSVLIMIFPRRLWKKIFSIGLLLIFLILGSWYVIKWQKLRPGQNNIVKVSNIKAESDVDLYNSDLFFKIDGAGQYGIAQSIWARTKDGQEKLVANVDQYNNISLNVKKGNTDFFGDFNKNVSQQNRYAFFSLQNLVTSPEYRNSYRVLFFDKETKQIGEIYRATLVDNPVEFSPDYKYMAVLHSELDGNQNRLKFYVDIMDVATLEITNRYYLPRHYTLYAMTYSEGAGRADWAGNVWKSNTEYQVAQFDDRKNIDSPWRGDGEMHVISVKSKEEAMAVLAKTDNVIIGLDNNKALYAEAEDGSLVEVDRNFGERFKDAGIWGPILAKTTSSTPFLFILGEGGYGTLYLANVVAKNDLSDVPLEKVPQSLRDGEWSIMIFSPNLSRVFTVTSDGAEIVDLIDLKVINKIEIPKGMTVYETAGVVPSGAMDGYFPDSFGNKTRWLSDDIFELGIYDAPVSKLPREPLQILRIDIDKGDINLK